MTIKEAANLLGVSELTIRIGLQQGVYPFGVAFKKSPDTKKYTYVLYAGEVRKYAGVENVQN